jgi:vacuolar protein sorting-associated protein 18
MQFLQDCELLKIEDILPFFPDFTRIDEFKDEICRSLEEYNKRIQDLKAEMDDATLSAEKTRKDISALRNKYGLVKAAQSCDICHFPVLTRQFYFFPCRHAFHVDCLIAEMQPHLTESERSRVAELLRLLETAQPETPSAPSPSRPEGEVSLELSRVDALKAELDNLVASQCVLCSDFMIKQINEPFILPSEKALQEKWAVENRSIVI